MSSLGVPERVQALLDTSSKYESAASGEGRRHARTVAVSVLVSTGATGGLGYVFAQLCA